MPIEKIRGREFYNYKLKDADKSVERRTTSSLHVKSSLRSRKKQGKFKRFENFLYNKEEKTACNRKGKHWGALIFYFMFFLGFMLILFFCYYYGVNRLMLLASTQSALPAEPKFYVSAIPTFSMVPATINAYTDPFVWYKMNGEDSETNRRPAPYVDSITGFYKSQANICAKRNMPKCEVEPKMYGPCGRGSFGYEDQQPCLLLKLIIRLGWQPNAYRSMNKVPQSMPKELKDNVNLNRETLCVHCEGENFYDKEKIGRVLYYPEACYSDSSFPFSLHPNSVNPTVSIQLANVQPGYVLSLTCRLFGVDADGTGEHKQSIFVYVGNK